MQLRKSKHSLMESVDEEVQPAGFTPPPKLQPHLRDAGAAADRVNFPPSNQHLGRLATKLSQSSKAR
jgi:hypothetical protein